MRSPYSRVSPIQQTGPNQTGLVLVLPLIAHVSPLPMTEILKSEGLKNGARPLPLEARRVVIRTQLKHFVENLEDS